MVGFCSEKKKKKWTHIRWVNKVLAACPRVIRCHVKAAKDAYTCGHVGTFFFDFLCTYLYISFLHKCSEVAHFCKNKIFFYSCLIGNRAAILSQMGIQNGNKVFSTLSITICGSVSCTEVGAPGDSQKKLIR